MLLWYIIIILSLAERRLHTRRSLLLCWAGPDTSPTFQESFISFHFISFHFSKVFNVKAECARPRPSFGILKVLRSKQKPISFTAPAQCPLSVRRNAILNCKLSLFCTGCHKPSLPLVFSVCLCRHSGGGGGAGQSATTLSNTLKGQVRCEVWGEW